MTFIVNEEGKILFEEFIFPDEFYYYDDTVNLSSLNTILDTSDKRHLLKNYSHVLCILCQCEDKYGDPHEYAYWNYFDENPQGMSNEERIRKIEINQIKQIATIHGNYIYQVEIKDLESYIDCDYTEIQEHLDDDLFWQNKTFQFSSESPHYFTNDLLTEKQLGKIKSKISEIELNDTGGRSFREIFVSYTK